MAQELKAKLEAVGVDFEKTLERLSGSVDIYTRFLKKFPNDPSFGALQSALAAGDNNEAQKAVHTLKGVAGTLGFTDLFNLSNDMLTDFRQGKPSDAIAKNGQLKELYDSVIKVLQTI